jgi:hypothetical protein
VLDLVDSIVDKGLVVDGEIVLGLADVDLIYLRLGALLAAADRVLDTRAGTGERRRKRREGAHPLFSTPPAGPAERSPSAPAASAAIAPATPAGPLAPDETSRSIVKLVLTLVDFVRRLLERQAVRRVREGTLTADETERLGTALMQLEQTIADFARQQGIELDELNLDLGPLGTLK